MSIINNFTDTEFIAIVNNSNNYTEIMKQMGYKSVSGNGLKAVKNRIAKLNISTEHFTNQTKGIVRTTDNVFCKDSTANQSVLRHWYKKGNYTDYKCSICGQEPFWNGKPMTLILDHINGENHDDRIENLRWVCPNCNIQLDTFGAKNKKQSVNRCIDCGVEISRTSCRCQKCSAKYRQQQSMEDKPSKEQLYQELTNSNFSAVGRKYGVSDNAVRKWCAYYGLPTHSSAYKNK